MIDQKFLYISQPTGNHAGDAALPLVLPPTWLTTRTSWAGIETGTLERLPSLRKERVQPKITERKGHIVKLKGDGLLPEQPRIASARSPALSRRHHDRSGQSSIRRTGPAVRAVL